MLVDPTLLHMLKELRMPGQPDPVAEIVDVFVQDSREVLGRLQAAHEEHDVEGVKQASHRMRGSAANLGATALVEHLGLIETSARSGTITEEATQSITALPALLRRTIEAIVELASD